MWLSLAAFIAVCVCLVDTITNHELEMKFHLRTPTEWEREWHQERYSRCRNSLKRHLEWACEKDIYKLNKRTDGNTPVDLSSYLSSNGRENADDFEADFPWPLQSGKWAFGMLRSKRGISRRSGEVPITEECCSREGCTWEEYAEYCTQNNRRVPQKRYEYVSEY